MSLHYVEIQEVYLIHTLIIKRAETKAGIRDFTLLHSAVERPKATFDGEDMYPSIFDKAAALLQSLTLNHPFTDGNGRVARLLLNLVLLQKNFPPLIVPKESRRSYITSLEKGQTADDTDDYYKFMYQQLIISMEQYLEMVKGKNRD